MFFLKGRGGLTFLHSFPTRRSSDLPEPRSALVTVTSFKTSLPQFSTMTDRKSTRLNSSHITISYAVFFLKNKNTVGMDDVGIIFAILGSIFPYAVQAYTIFCSVVMG